MCAAASSLILKCWMPKACAFPHLSVMSLHCCVLEKGDCFFDDSSLRIRPISTDSKARAGVVSAIVLVHACFFAFNFGIVMPANA